MKNKILVLVCLIGLYANSQTVAGVDTLWKSGPINKRINLVIMGDGYTAAETTQFIADATNIVTYLFNNAPFSNYKNYFNVFAIKCVSPQSGVSHPGTATDVTEPASPIVNVTNYFNTRFDNYNVHRLIYSMNPTAVYNVLSNHFPNYDQVVILGNSTEYGGAGGAYAVSSVHSNSKEIVLHELGHSFAGLADEYWAGASYAAEKPNMTSNNNASTIKWSPWMGINGIGAYPYGSVAPDNQWFRPHQNCKMRFLNAPFCSVCKETIIEKIHDLTNPIDDYTPPGTASTSFTMSSQWFKGTLIKPIPNTLKTLWDLNSNIIANNKDSLEITSTMLNNGINSLNFSVYDTTGLSKDQNNHAAFHFYTVSWNLTFSDVGIKDIKPQIEYSTFPNPAADVLNVKYNLFEESEIAISIVDMNGRVVVTNKQKKQSAGEYKTELNTSGLSNGSYILSIKINQQTINNKFVISK